MEIKAGGTALTAGHTVWISGVRAAFVGTEIEEEGKH
jgi:hypothetical protein